MAPSRERRYRPAPWAGSRPLRQDITLDPSAEAAIQTGASVFAEWLDATRTDSSTEPKRLAAIADFAGLCPALGWAGNLRRGRGDKVAIRRGERAWTYSQLANSDADWREAAGRHADGSHDTLVAIVADHLLRADTRPDDTLVWRGDPADPWPFGALMFGATVILTP